MVQGKSAVYYNLIYIEKQNGFGTTKARHLNKQIKDTALTHLNRKYFYALSPTEESNITKKNRIFCFQFITFAT